MNTPILRYSCALLIGGALLFPIVFMPAIARGGTVVRRLGQHANPGLRGFEVNESLPRGVTGACCVGATCVTTDAVGCTSLGGDYGGNGTDCATFACIVDVTLTPSKDNTLFAPSGAYSNGMGMYIFAGTTATNDPRRALLQFDFSTIPSNATISSATLTMFMSRTVSGNESVGIHAVVADWGEGASDAPHQEGGGAGAQANDATWLYRFYNPSDPPSSPAWVSPGGDFGAVPRATTAVGSSGQFYSWSSPDMLADVQAWVAGTQNNFGWLVKGNEAVTRSAKRFDSVQNPVPAQRPMLAISYTVPNVTGACCFGDGTCAALSQVACTAQGITYEGDGTTCTPNPCLIATGACCLNNGTCLSVTQVSCGDVSGTYQGDGIACTPGLCPIVLEPFVDALPLPAAAVPTTGKQGGEATYDIAIQQAQQQLHRDLPPTTIWGYSGSYPGPTIEAGRDLPVTINWLNDLRDGQGELRTDHHLTVDLCPHGAENLPKAVVHLHGGHVPAAVDGYPEFTWLPGESETYVYPNNQRAATIWYHDHSLGITRLNVYMGLAGFYIIRDPVEQALALPSGENEIALAIQDRAFNVDGTFDYPDAWVDHYVGDKMLVNGKVWPFLEVRRGKYRFRMLNGCNSRTLTLALSNGGTLNLIGTDGGLLPAPIALTEMTLAPAERADVIVDFAPYTPGTEIVLTNSAPAPFPGTPGVGVVPDVMKFVVSAKTGDTTTIPATLQAITQLNDLDAVATRDFELRRSFEPCAGGEWRINGLGWDDITEQPLLGTTEVWQFINRSAMMHPMHMHLVFFQVLDRQPFEIIDDVVTPTGVPADPEATETGWKDTVQVGPFEIVRVIARFEDYTGLYPYHCHILEHEDHEMMRQFESICTKGDTNQDTLVNGADIDLFVDTLVTGGEPGTAAFCATDMNDSDALEISVDVSLFVDCLVAGNCP